MTDQVREQVLTYMERMLVTEDPQERIVVRGGPANRGFQMLVSEMQSLFSEIRRHRQLRADLQQMVERYRDSINRGVTLDDRGYASTMAARVDELLSLPGRSGEEGK
jgi:hypothetical protein